MSDPAVEAAKRAWDTFLQSRMKHLTAERAMDVSIDAAREALKPIRALAELLTAAAAFEDAEVEHGMKLVLNELAPLVYTSEELSSE